MDRRERIEHFGHFRCALKPHHRLIRGSLAGGQVFGPPPVVPIVERPLPAYLSLGRALIVPNRVGNVVAENPSHPGEEFGFAFPLKAVKAPLHFQGGLLHNVADAHFLSQSLGQLSGRRKEQQRPGGFDNLPDRPLIPAAGQHDQLRDWPQRSPCGGSHRSRVSNAPSRTLQPVALPDR